MAARILLLSILFTEVLKPVYAAGVKGVGSGLNGKNGSKSDGLDIGFGRNVSLDIEPKGNIILGKKSITLSCSGGLNNEITWLYNGVPAPPCGITRCTVLRNGSLHFYKKKNLQVMQKHKTWDYSEAFQFKNKKKDEYRCVTRTNFGGRLRSSPVYIQVAEFARIFKESPKDLTIHEGEVARFSCFINSVPFPPNITWQHNGEVVISNTNNTKYFITQHGVLYISATKLSDAGSYRCIASNEFLNKTKKSKEARLTIIPRNKYEKHPVPSVLFPQTSYSYLLLNGTSTTIACAASGYPLPLTSWSFISRQSDTGQPRLLVNSTTGISILSLLNVSVSDAGHYVCSSKSSDYDNTKYQNITIDVLVPPTFIKKPTNQVCPNGRTARFECQAQGLPTPQIYWLKDSTNITNNGRKTIYRREFNKMELAISATVPSDSGIYQCVAINAAGEIWAAGRLQVNTSRNSPAAPTSLKCKALSPVKILISWKPPKLLPHTSITAYTVHYSPIEGGKEEVSPPEPGNSTSVEVTKLLEPFTNYSFYVRVWNNHGASDQSAAIVCSTAPSVPKITPKTEVDVISSTKLNVTWAPLNKKEAQGIVVQYKLQWRLHQSPSSRVQCLPANIEHYVLTDLIPGAQYDIRVLAKTEQGWPDVNESQLQWINITMPPYGESKVKTDIIDMRLKNINSTTLKVQWQIKEVNNNTIDSKFDSWKVYYENDEGKRTSISLLKNVTEYTLQTLVENKTYTIGLCMMNSDSDVGCVAERIESTHALLNNVPTAVEATPVSSDAIHLSWSLANKNKESLFEVCYHAVLSLNEDTKCITVDNTDVTIDKLNPFTLYQFKIRTLSNNNGDNQNSAFSEVVECYSKEDVPEKVKDLQWFFTNSTNIRIAWKEPSKKNGVIQKYLVSYTNDVTQPTSAWETIVVSGNKTSADFPTLISGKRYFVQVQAFTKAGYGKPSDRIIILTGSNASKIPTFSNEQKPSLNSKPDQSLGIILGVVISIVFITICLCSIYCRKKCENSRLLRDNTQPLKGRIFTRNGNGCCSDQVSASVSQQNVTSSNVCNEIELAVLCPSTPLSTNPHCDTKGGINGIVERCMKEPLLLPWNVNGDATDIRITENPQYKNKGSNISLNQQKEKREEDQDGENEKSKQDLEITQLTVVNCTFDDRSNSNHSNSLNNNLGIMENNTDHVKAAHLAVMPIVSPNG